MINKYVIHAKKIIIGIQSLLIKMCEKTHAKVAHNYTIFLNY